MPHKFNLFFFFATSQFDWPIAKRKSKLWTLSETKDSMEGWSASLPLWPTYIGEKGRTLGKIYGI